MNEHSLKQRCEDLHIFDRSDLKGYLSSIRPPLDTKQGALGIPLDYDMEKVLQQFLPYGHLEPHDNNGDLQYSADLNAFEQSIKILKNTGPYTLQPGDPVVLMPMDHMGLSHVQDNENGGVLGLSTLSMPVSIARLGDRVMFPATVSKWRVENIIRDVMLGVICEAICKQDTARYKGLCETNSYKYLIINQAASGKSPMMSTLREPILKYTSQLSTHIWSIKQMLCCTLDKDSFFPSSMPQHGDDLQNYYKTIEDLLNPSEGPTEPWVSKTNKRANTLQLQHSIGVVLHSIRGLYHIMRPPHYGYVQMSQSNTYNIAPQGLFTCYTTNENGRATVLSKNNEGVRDSYDTEPGFYYEFGLNKKLPSIEVDPGDYSSYASSHNALKRTKLKALGAEIDVNFRTAAVANNGPDFFNTTTKAYVCAQPRINKEGMSGPAILRSCLQVEEQHIQSFQAYAAVMMAACHPNYYESTKEDEIKACFQPGILNNPQGWMQYFILYHSVKFLSVFMGSSLRVLADSMSSSRFVDRGVTRALEMEPIGKPTHRLDWPQVGYEKLEDELRYLGETTKRTDHDPPTHEDGEDDFLFYSFKNWSKIQKKGERLHPIREACEQNIMDVIFKSLTVMMQVARACVYCYEPLRERPIAVVQKSGHGAIKRKTDGTTILPPGSKFIVRSL